ncbi:WhiB family transcriptional regulator [Rhodococcus koreensis]
MASPTLSVTLPKPIAELWDWQRDARCISVGSEVFFGPEGERRDAREHREHTTKQYCRTCTVRRECRNYALQAGEPFGVWGGMSEVDRRFPRTDHPDGRRDGGQSDRTGRPILCISPAHPLPGRHRAKVCR